MVREFLEVGKYRYKVYDSRGHLILVSENANIAQIYYERGEAEELQRRKYAELRSNDAIGQQNEGD